MLSCWLISNSITYSIMRSRATDGTNEFESKAAGSGSQTPLGRSMSGGIHPFVARLPASSENACRPSQGEAAVATILVTGGAGFVGSHACKALARAGYSPVTFDNLERGHEWAVKWGPLERGDLRDERALHRVFERWKPWAVMHFAAYAYVAESNIDPPNDYHNNIGETAK